MRIGEIATEPDEALLPYLRAGVANEIARLTETLNKFDPPPYLTIPDFLTKEGLSLLEVIDVPINGKCPEEVLLAHPVGGSLARTMGAISLANMDMRHKPTRTVYSLKNETGEDFLLEPHRDFRWPRGAF